MDRVEKSLRYLRWCHIAGAVLDVFDENRAAEPERGVLASSDDWCIVSTFREEIHQRAAHHWRIRIEQAGLTRESPAGFPFSVDQVAELYFKFRKRSDDERAAFRREIEGLSGGRLFP
jgi:hypothetical protein